MKIFFVVLSLMFLISCAKKDDEYLKWGDRVKVTDGKYIDRKGTVIEGKCYYNCFVALDSGEIINFGIKLRGEKK